MTDDDLIAKARERYKDDPVVAALLELLDVELTDFGVDARQEAKDALAAIREATK